MKAKVANADAFLDEARKKGLIITETRTNFAALEGKPAEEPEGKVALLPSVHVPPSVWIVGVETRSEANGRQWKDRSNRTKAAREAVSKLFGKSLATLALFAEHYHNGGSVLITFTRLAPKRLDRGNVSVALKGVEDALALMLGADDGDPRWLPSYEQETSERYGVRIKLGHG